MVGDLLTHRRTFGSAECALFRRLSSSGFDARSHCYVPIGTVLVEVRREMHTGDFFAGGDNDNEITWVMRPDGVIAGIWSEYLERVL